MPNQHSNDPGVPVMSSSLSFWYAKVSSSRAKSSFSLSLVIPDDAYPPQSFLPHTLFLVAMHIFFWLFLLASTSHAIHVPISRYKFTGPSPLEKRAQGHGGLSYNVLAAGNSSKDLKSVHYPSLFHSRPHSIVNQQRP